ncbi:putative Ribosomal protein S30 [Monocercomonoides exilis]|uniref:putative Ribosomal protein S30 n=1 Tax=Monocercomonoides exilis TaxID=2049356 RepID=UPI0035596686|nr:putative Ribosomal protein S30 [Monocercomonoides exilis]
MGKVHGALSRAGKVRDHTPKVPKQQHKRSLQEEIRFVFCTRRDSQMLLLVQERKVQTSKRPKEQMQTFFKLLLF